MFLADDLVNNKLLTSRYVLNAKDHYLYIIK